MKSVGLTILLTMSARMQRAAEPASSVKAMRFQVPALTECCVSTMLIVKTSVLLGPLALQVACLSCPWKDVAAAVATVVVATNEHLFLGPWPTALLVLGGVGFLGLYQQSLSVCSSIKRPTQ